MAALVTTTRLTTAVAALAFAAASAQAATAAVHPTRGSACGRTIEVAPRNDLGLGPAPLAIGDSVLYDAAVPVADYGFRIDAMVCRTMAQGLALLQARGRSLPALVVVALGTNGGATTAQLEQLLRIIGPQRLLGLVTPRHGTDPSTPALYRAVAARDPAQIELLDWDRISAAHPAWFAPDGIHLSGAAGPDAYARLIAGALLGRPLPPASTAPQAPSTTIQPAPPHPRARMTPKPRPPIDGIAAADALTAIAAVEAICLALAG